MPPVSHGQLSFPLAPLSATQALLGEYFELLENQPAQVKHMI